MLQACDPQWRPVTWPVPVSGHQRRCPRGGGSLSTLTATANAGVRANRHARTPSPLCWSPAAHDIRPPPNVRGAVHALRRRPEDAAAAAAAALRRRSTEAAAAATAISGCAASTDSAIAAAAKREVARYVPATAAGARCDSCQHLVRCRRWQHGFRHAAAAAPAR